MEGIPDADMKEHERSRGSEYAPPVEAKKPMASSAAAVVAAATGMMPSGTVGVNVGGAPHGPPFVGVNVMPIPGLPYGIPSGVPSGVPSGIPSGVPSGIPSNAHPQYGNFAPNLAQGQNPGSFGAAIPPPPSLAPPHTIVGAARAAGHVAAGQLAAGHVAGLPNKPLFPSVSGSSSSSQSGSVVGTDFKPLVMNAGPGPGPAGSAPFLVSVTSANTTVSASAIISKPASSATIATAGATSKIVHPEEDISLEELRARRIKYKSIIPQSASPVNGMNPNAAVYSTPGAPPGAPPMGANLLVAQPALSLPAPLPAHPLPAHPSFQSTFRPAY